MLNAKQLAASRDVLFAKCYFCDQIKNNQMSGACSTYGDRGEMHIGFWLGNLR